ncbi:MAG TPA: urease accessory protein UreE, partial [Azospirillaceae bacterium]|nr:urease accessory protein UreE [Azospirillaceae bacterium]
MTLPRAFRVVAQPNLSADMLADWVVLDHADRHRRRLALTGENGVAFLLDLEKPAALADGDVLTLDDGRLIGVRAAPQRLYAV